MFFACAFVALRATTRPLALTSALIALAIESSQLVHPDWLEAVRRWPAGKAGQDLGSFSILG